MDFSLAHIEPVVRQDFKVEMLLQEYLGHPIGVFLHVEIIGVGLAGLIGMLSKLIQMGAHLALMADLVTDIFYILLVFICLRDESSLSLDVLQKDK